MQTLRPFFSERESGRQPTKQRAIVSSIAAGIAAGRYRSGDQLPSWEALRSEFDTTIRTVQRALALLREDGTVETVANRGTYVAARPPCLCRFALVHAGKRGGHHWRGLDAALVASAERLEQEGEVFFALYDNLEHPASARRIAQLREDVALGRFAGVFFASNPLFLDQAAAQTFARFPCLAVQRPCREAFPCPSACHSGPPFVDLAVERLHRHGCKRIALLVISGMPADTADRFAAALGRLGLRYDPEHIQGLAMDQPHWTRHLVRLLLSGDPARRPDGLVIHDDTLGPDVMSEIAAMGIAVPRDLKLVLHSNFPSLAPAALPAERLGYDILDLLRRAVASLGARRRGDSGKDVPMPIRFEEELTETSSMGVDLLSTAPRK